KQDLINVLKEIGEQATSKETIIELKTKFEKSAAFKDDPDFVINLLNLSVEDRQAKAERQLQEINSQLELEKIKLQQIEREIELLKTLAEGQATQQSSKGDTNNLESLIKSVKTLTVQIPTKTENFGLFFQSLERSFRVKNVPENLKAEILINPPTKKHGFFHPTREASKTDHTEFFLRPGTHQKMNQNRFFPLQM
ncbi:uncharacterized protein TNCV_3484291, partial [Trichonephila clavipes]